MQWRKAQVSAAISVGLLMSVALPTKSIVFTSGAFDCSLAVPWVEKRAALGAALNGDDDDGIADVPPIRLAGHEFAGFTWGSFGITYYFSVRIPDDRSYLGIPWWPVALVGSALVGRPSMREFLRARRGRAGRCPQCGYDLRAGHDRCPECGSHCDIICDSAPTIAPHGES
jgi:hypothetical protein